MRPSPINGMGVFAALDFADGDVILEVSGLRLVTEHDPLREGEQEHHCDWLADGRQMLIPYPARHINHSCDPNAYKRYVNGRRYTVARRAITAGEEITHDYCINGFGDVVWECNCGSDRCRKTIHSDFFHLPLDLQLEYLPHLDEIHKTVYANNLRRLTQMARMTP